MVWEYGYSGCQQKWVCRERRVATCMEGNMRRIVRENGFGDVQKEMEVCMEARKMGVRLRRVMTCMEGETWVQEGGRDE